MSNNPIADVTAEGINSAEVVAAINTIKAVFTANRTQSAAFSGAQSLSEAIGALLQLGA
jgi:hypothetical protein